MMLRALPHSPYVRKVRVVAHEAGIADRLEYAEVHVFDPATPLMGENPLGKVPALVRDDGSVLYDSTVICQYIDTLHGAPRLFPPEGEALWQALRRNALGDGLGQAVCRGVCVAREPHQTHGLAVEIEAGPAQLDRPDTERLIRSVENWAVDGSKGGFPAIQVRVIEVPEKRV